MSVTFSNSQSSPGPVAIVGGGFSGSVLAVQLLRKSCGRLSVCLIERSPGAGRGVAYGTRCSDHLLNVPANDMSAFPDDPEHFLRWARSLHNPDVQGGDFLPRCCYGDYVQSVLRQEIERFPGSFEHIEEEAVDLGCRDGAVQVKLRSGRTRMANKAVLAMGNFPPAPLRSLENVRSSTRYVGNPWEPNALAAIAPSEDVLLVGSGLTSVDIVIALRALGHRGRIYLLSRHGFLPTTHRNATGWPSFGMDCHLGTLVEWMAQVRLQLTLARSLGYDWRAVIDATRPTLQPIWHSLPVRERRRFLRHLRPYWEIHRHRIAPAIGARIDAEIAAGRSEVHPGRIIACREEAGSFTVRYQNRHSGSPREISVQRIVNCTGPETDCRRIESPLLASLLQSGLARPDELFLGLDCARDGALIAADGAASTLLYALGPARKGSLWETTAVPEIRVQAATLADLLVVGDEKQKSKFPTEPAVSPVFRANPETPAGIGPLEP
jgi:uncharacterized NAD(P)/FAD-binding protein YdhS